MILYFTFSFRNPLVSKPFRELNCYIVGNGGSRHSVNFSFLPLIRHLVFFIQHSFMLFILVPIYNYH